MDQPSIAARSRAADVAILGREPELRALSALFEDDGPAVAHLYGMPGIGKTALLRRLVALAQERGIKAHLLDCRVVEPTEDGMRRALEKLALPVAASTDRTVIGLDNYESFLLLDSWIRTELVPRFGGAVRLVLCGRNQPNPAWLAADGVFLGLRLRELAAADALRLLAGHGLGPDDANLIQGYAKGHPLALKLALTAVRDHAGEARSDLAMHEVVGQLTGFFLDGVTDVATRRALEAASTVRRTTVPLLASMLHEEDGTVLYEQLARLSIVESHKDGLVLHPAVHEAVAQHLRSADPGRFLSYRRAAWRALEDQSRDVAPGDLWRYTADVIYLIDNPIVREAFFPSGAQRLSVESARAEDRDDVLAIADLQGGAAERAVMAGWWRVLPSAFAVVRDVDRTVTGFCCLLDPAMAPDEMLAADPMTRAWVRHLPAELVGQPRRALFLRRWLGREHGEGPSQVQAACWLDVKRSYLACRPQLRRVYLAVADLLPYTSAAQQLGFAPALEADELPLSTAVLEFGAGSVDAWLRHLVRQELGLRDEIVLDEGARMLLVGDDRIELTQLEFGVMRALLRSAGDVVGRNQLLDDVWGDKQAAVGSNVVDVVIRALRKKLDRHSEAIVTVRGVGYRFGR